MKIPALLFFLVLANSIGYAQSDGSNVVLITLDGFRWQELFNGADSILLHNRKSTTDQQAIGRYWHNDVLTRRSALMPFLWSVVAKDGQLLGNRAHKNRVDCDNPFWFSYPGYNEMLTGSVDRSIRSNDTIVNSKMTVLEFVGQQKGYQGRVAAFGTWGVFPYILREKTSGIYVNAGLDEASGLLTEREVLLNELQQLMPNPVTERHDVFTMFYAIEYMKRARPKVVFVALDETDSYAHGGRYDEYLKAANRSDQLIRNLWDFIQSNDFYRDNTTILITTDHGRGYWYKHDRMNWRSHGRKAPGSGQVWIAALGKQVPSIGEATVEGRFSLSQIAPTLAGVLGLDYPSSRGPIESIVPKNLARSK